MSFFFKNFSEIEYAFISEPDDKKNVTNILSAFFLNKLNTLQKSFFNIYTVRDDDSLESLSEKIYRNPLYYWVFLIINNIIDPFSEWGMQYSVLEEFVRKKYKNGIQKKLKNLTDYTLPASEGLNGIHHFINVQTNLIVDDVDDELYRQLWLDSNGNIGNNIVPITNFQYEQDLNIEKRKIFIISPNQIVLFINEFNETMKGLKI